MDNQEKGTDLVRDQSLKFEATWKTEGPLKNSLCSVSLDGFVKKLGAPELVIIERWDYFLRSGTVIQDDNKWNLLFKYPVKVFRELYV